MRLLAYLVLTTVVASAFAQDGAGALSKSSVIHLYPSPFNQLSRSALEDYRVQLEAVNALPNVDVQVVDETYRDAANATEPETSDSAVDPSSAIVEAVNEAVETVAASLSEDPPEAEDEEAVEEVVEEVVEDVVEEVVEEVVEQVVEDAMQEDPATTSEVSEDGEVVDEVVEDEVHEEDPALTAEMTEEETVEVDENVPEEAGPVLEADAVETPTPEMETEAEAPVDPDAAVLSVEPEPEPEPSPDDMKDEQYTAEETEEEVVDVEEEPSEPTKKELKAIEKYNAAVDNVVKILSERLEENDALPLNVSTDTLADLDVEVTTVPPTTTTTTTEAPVVPECPAKWVEKCATEKCMNKEKCKRKCKDKGCITKKNKKNKNKNKNRKDDDDKKNKNKKNKNKKRKNRKNNNKRIGSKLFISHRQSKDLKYPGDEQGRRQRDNGKKRTKGKKGNKNRSRLDPDAKPGSLPKSADEGPLLASKEELMNAPALVAGFSKLRREGDVEVDLSGKFPRFIATVMMGPLNVLLTDPLSQLERTEVTTELTARMHFTAKPVRGRDKLKINEVVVEVPKEESVSVLRSDLELEPDVVSAAQDQVSSAIDTDRLARIFHQDLDAAFDEDNILQNLEDHPSLKN